jgi:transaldolase
MALNKQLAELSEAGVAVWLDALSRDRIRSGDLQSSTSRTSQARTGLPLRSTSGW